MNGHFTPDPGEMELMYCDVCGNKMDVERNVHGATGFAEAMAKSGHDHDLFTCVAREEMWHKQVYQLYEAGRESPSKRIENIMLDEAREILNNHKETKHVRSL